MALLSYKVKLEGHSQLHEPTVRLEHISINLWTINGGETWENKNVEVDVNGTLEVFMSCKAISGTGWDFTITNLTSGSKVVEESGQTGDQIPNFSELRKSVNP